MMPNADDLWSENARAGLRAFEANQRMFSDLAAQGARIRWEEEQRQMAARRQAGLQRILDRLDEIVLLLKQNPNEAERKHLEAEAQRMQRLFDGLV
jgi:hypothetical protein